MSYNAYSGTYVPNNPNKYKGTKKIIWRSSWELKFMKYCDRNPKIIEWVSEPFSIKYYLPTTGKWHKYYPDFLITSQNRQNERQRTLIEIKPEHQTKPPKKGNKKRKTIITEQKTWVMNQSKWKFAKEFCKRKGIIFRILTEKELLI